MKIMFKATISIDLSIFPQFTFLMKFRKYRLLEIFNGFRTIWKLWQQLKEWITRNTCE